MQGAKRLDERFLCDIVCFRFVYAHIAGSYEINHLAAISLNQYIERGAVAALGSLRKGVVICARLRCVAGDRYMRRMLPAGSM